MDQMERSRLEGTWEGLIIPVVRNLTDSLLCVFSCSNNSCLWLSVDRWQVMMVFPSLFLIIYFLLPLFIEFPFLVVFPDLNLPKAGLHSVRFFDCFSSCGADTVCKLSMGFWGWNWNSSYKNKLHEYWFFKSSSRNFLFLACYSLFLSHCMTLSFSFFKIWVWL